MTGDGYLVLGRWRGVAIRVHWTMPLGAGLLVWERLSIASCLAIAFLMLVHELGHATVARWCGGRVHALALTGVGGDCAWTGRVSPLGRAWIAWGGIGAQLLVGIATIALLPYLGEPDTAPGPLVDGAYVLTVSNLLLVLANLLPFGPFDGAEAWRVVRLLRGPRRPRPDADVDARVPRWILDRQLREQLDRVFASATDDRPGRPDVELEEDATPPATRRP